MSRRHLVVVFSLAAGAALALPVTPAYAAPTAVYVDSGGDDAHDCSQASPCLTVARGIEAVADGGTVNVGAGTFDGELRPGMLGKSVSMVGLGLRVRGHEAHRRLQPRRVRARGRVRHHVLVGPA